MSSGRAAPKNNRRLDTSGTSGDVLPRILREKLRRYRPPESGGGEGGAPLGAAIRAALLEHDEDGEDEVLPLSRMDRLERVIQRTADEMAEMQKQIQREEEVYYEDTYGFGNLISGFESVLDARGVVGDGGGGFGSNANLLRRMPADARWFSLPLRAYPMPPPPAITDQVPITVEDEDNEACGHSRRSATMASPSAAALVPVSAKRESSASVSSNIEEAPPPSDREDDDDETNALEGEDEDDDGNDDAPAEAAASVAAVAEPRETRSKRKSTTPLPSRRPKRKKR
jgi:hypothetical protein